MTGPEAPPDGAPPRRRTPWSFKTLVEDVAGKPLSEFQDPPDRSAGGSSAIARSSARASPPMAAAPPAVSASAVPATPPIADPSSVAIPAAVAEPLEEIAPDPVARVYPPLSGSTGRALHGADAEHHAPTLESVRSPEEALSPGSRLHRPGPSRRPERIYLHYLLLHLDRLNDGGLRYLKRAVDEELAHREPPPDDG
ncbi:MAG TPA: hypothetical protein VMH90_03015 [Thermoplasmata archaeon]|nr:hypothetical protein [Thermoplasmata archaeon]